jgi:hypothetical protein
MACRDGILASSLCPNAEIVWMGDRVVASPR